MSPAEKEHRPSARDPSNECLAVVETHPIQYHAPVYREIQQKHGLRVAAIYGSDFSVAGYLDKEFNARFAWDTDLLSGYESHFLARVEQGGAASAETVGTSGLPATLRRIAPRAAMIVGYSPSFHRKAFRAACGEGLPILFRGETTDHAQTRGRIKSWLRDWMLRRIYRGCARLLYVGKHSRSHFERLGFASDSLIFSPYCVDTTPFTCGEESRATLRAEGRVALEIAPESQVILFSGKLSSRKGVDVLMEATKTLPDSIRDHLVLVFVGSGERQEALQALAQQSPRVAVRFPGFQNQRQLSKYYHAADLLTLPSLWSETWGLVVNEALHHGLPVVVTEGVGCAPDLVEPGRTGEIAATGSVSSLTAALTRGLELARRPETRTQCRERVHRYTVAHAAQGIVQAYREATSS